MTYLYFGLVLGRNDFVLQEVIPHVAVQQDFCHQLNSISVDDIFVAGLTTIDLTEEM
jgi:hypothetical protein